jgi:hypothetical protein
LQSDISPKDKRDPIDIRDIWTPELLVRLRHPGPTREILEALSAEPAAIFDILFYASFSDKILTVMRREGKDADGFVRMQQSFREVVEKVRGGIGRAVTLGFSKGSRYIELSPDGMSALLELVHDLAVVKDWQQRETGTAR